MKGGGRGFILTERVKTQKPKHYTRWGGVGGKGCFLKTTQILLVKFPCTTVKKKCLRSRRKKTVLGQFSVQTKKLNNFNIQFDGKKRELMEFFERSTFSLQKILTKHLSKVSRILPSC